MSYEYYIENQKNIKKYQIISCPGCYPTSILLPLIPLIKKKLIQLDNIIVDSKSGYSGAGRSVHKKYANKIMRLRIVAQFFAVILILAFVYFSGAGN